MSVWAIVVQQRQQRGVRGAVNSVSCQEVMFLTEGDTVSHQIVLTDRQASSFRKFLRGAKCTSIMHHNIAVNLSRQPIKGYIYSGGWKVEGFPHLYLLYITCPRCKYDYVLWKLGVPRKFDPTQTWWRFSFFSFLESKMPTKGLICRISIYFWMYNS